MKVLLMTPPYHSGIVESAGKWPPLNLAYLGSAAEMAGAEVVIYDAMVKDHDLGQIKHNLRFLAPDVLAITAMTPSLPAALEVLKTAKKINPRLITVMGGVHPTFCAESLVEEPDIDYVVQGEGETVFFELIRALIDGRSCKGIKGLAGSEEETLFCNQPGAFLENLERFTPAWHLLDWSDYPFFVIEQGTAAVVSSSRGCLHNCNFCSQCMLWKNSWRGREPRAFVDEIELLHTKYGRNTFLIADEHPTHDRRRWEEVLDLLIKKQLSIYILMETRAEDILRDKDILAEYRKAGIIHMFVGAEATEQSRIDLFGKGLPVESIGESIKLLDEHGITTETSYIMGTPGDTAADFQSIMEGAKKHNADLAHFLAIMPWPFTPMAARMEELIRDRDLSNYNYVTPVASTGSVEPHEIKEAILRCYSQYYQWKVPRWDDIQDDFKREYLKNALKQIMNRSFLHQQNGKGKMPEAAEQLLRKLGMC